LKFPVYVGGGEGAYNKSIAKSHPTQYTLLDEIHKISHGGGHGQVEVCDLLSANRKLIHVKIYSKSSVLSHLFAQGFVSGQLGKWQCRFRIKRTNDLATFFATLRERTSRGGGSLVGVAAQAQRARRGPNERMGTEPGGTVA
jgi:uncharacterized protein (TIGR04141 family)